MQLIYAYFATLVTFLVLDVAFLTLVIQPVFKADVPELLRASPRLDVSALFYAAYALGLLYFAVAPALAGGSWLAAARDGAILGAVGYGVYELTNMATLSGWTWRMVRLDLAWGTALSGFSAAIGTYVATRV